jgi:hypothetical protein
MEHLVLKKATAEKVLAAIQAARIECAPAQEKELAEAAGELGAAAEAAMTPSWTAAQAAMELLTKLLPQPLVLGHLECLSGFLHAGRSVKNALQELDALWGLHVLVEPVQRLSKIRAITVDISVTHEYDDQGGTYQCRDCDTRVELSSPLGPRDLPALSTLKIDGESLGIGAADEPDKLAQEDVLGDVFREWAEANDLAASFCDGDALRFDQLALAKAAVGSDIDLRLLRDAVRVPPKEVAA